MGQCHVFFGLAGVNKRAIFRGSSKMGPIWGGSNFMQILCQISGRSSHLLALKGQNFGSSTSHGPWYQKHIRSSHLLAWNTQMERRWNETRYWDFQASGLLAIRYLQFTTSTAKSGWSSPVQPPPGLEPPLEPSLSEVEPSEREEAADMAERISESPTLEETEDLKRDHEEVEASEPGAELLVRLKCMNIVVRPTLGCGDQPQKSCSQRVPCARLRGRSMAGPHWYPLEV